MIVKNRRLWLRADRAMSDYGFEKMSEDCFVISYKSDRYRINIYHRADKNEPYRIQCGLYGPMGITYLMRLPNELKKPLMWKIRSVGWNKPKKTPKDRYTNHLF